MNNARTIGFRRRHLPHWTVADRSYFVTIRIKRSLPVQVVNELLAEKEAFLARHPDTEAMNEFRKARFEKVEAILDSARSGPMFLDIAPVGDLVVDAFVWLEHRKGWRVTAVTIMPNHVHALLRNEQGENHRLNEHLGILKGYTAREANRLLNRSGAFWADENFDHWCRDEQERLGYIEYIRQNPVKAGLVSQPEHWPWTRVKSQ